MDNYCLFTGKLEGEPFFQKYPSVCQIVASLCTVSCVASMFTITAMSVNRYVFICVNESYSRIFSHCNTICMCVSVYLIGAILVSLNFADIGDHGFDPKSLECIWDRMATYPYTVVFSVVMVWIPAIVTASSYARIYIYVRSHSRRVKEVFNSISGDKNMVPSRSFHLAKTLGLIYVVFITCWSPYALVLIIDTTDSFPHELHVFCTMFAHLHPSLNWLIYYLTNKKFCQAYKEIFSCRKSHMSSSDVHAPNAK